MVFMTIADQDVLLQFIAMAKIFLITMMSG